LPSKFQAAEPVIDAVQKIINRRNVVTLGACKPIVMTFEISDLFT